MVKIGLVMPMVKTTMSSAIPATFLRGVFMTGESCEMLSRPEKARNEPAKPIKIETGVSVSCANIAGNSDRDMCKNCYQNSYIARKGDNCSNKADFCTLTDTNPVEDPQQNKHTNGDK